MIIGIDPGQSGGIAWKFQGKVYIKKMPETPKDIFLFLHERALEADSYEDIIAYVEKVGGYMPGNSGPAAVKFARHCGHLEMALLALNIPYHEILPNRWMIHFIGKQKYPASMTAAQRKTKRKNLIKAKAQALSPNIKVTLAVSDAIGILNYAMKQEGAR